MSKIKLPIVYDKSAQIISVHDSMIPFIGMEDLFDNFRFVVPEKKSWTSELAFAERIDSIGLPIGSSPSQMLRSSKMVKYSKTHPKAKYLVYSPIGAPYKINPLQIIMNSPTLTHAYENKRYFREEFSELIRMPEYEVWRIDQLDTANAYRTIRKTLGEKIVLQDEESSGSKGTFIVKNDDDFADSVASLKKHARGRSIIVSTFVEGTIASVQVCISRYGIFAGAIQKQLIATPELCNPALVGSSAWCGGEVGVRMSDIIHHQAQEMATIVGSELSSHGYKGIFGIDLMITESNQVYAIEINARLTGYSHIISDMQMREGKIPFILLHTLELANMPYEVTDLNALPSNSFFSKAQSLMIISNPVADDFKIQKSILPGIYKIGKDGKIELSKVGARLNGYKGESGFQIICTRDQGQSVSAGKRIVYVVKPGKVLIGKKLGPKSKKIVDAVKASLELV
jgi:ATP-grasp domain